MDLNISALQTAPEKRCFPFPTMVYSACSMETGTGTFNDKRVLLNADFLGPSAKMNVNEVRQLLRTRAGDQPKVCHLGIGVKKVGRRNHVI